MSSTGNRPQATTGQLAPNRPGADTHTAGTPAPTTRTRPPGPPAAPRKPHEPSATTIPALDTAPLLRDEEVSFHPQPGVLPAQLRQLGLLRRRQTRAFASIRAGLTDPVPQRALTDTETLRYLDDPIALVEDHRHRVPLELIGERAPRPRRPPLHH